MPVDRRTVFGRMRGRTAPVEPPSPELVPVDAHSVPRTNTYSQSGEDAILRAVFDELQIERGRLCEIGAWDGKHLSNCMALLERGWSGVHIESQPDRAQVLRDNVSPFGSHAVCAMVGPAASPTAVVLDDAGAEPHFNLLSVDIDSDDLAVVEEFLASRTADVIVVEYNSSVPNDVPFVNTPGQTWGNSALAVTRAIGGRGFTLVAHTDCNLVFVADVHARTASGGHRFAPAPISGEGGPGLVRSWWGYDGSLFLAYLDDVRANP